MKRLLAIIAASLVSVSAQNTPAETYYKKLARIEAGYRLDFSKVLAEADRVVLYIVTFDEIKKPEPDPFGNSPSFGDDPNAILIAPYERKTRILKEKELQEKHRKELLDSLSKQIAVEEHAGGALCHYPIHGIRIYSGKNIIHEGTFCWVCNNFSFSYPEGVTWLDTTEELRALFTRILPIPKTELDRFIEKHPKK